MLIYNWKTILKYRNIIYGMSAVWIVLFHLIGYHNIRIFVAFLLVALFIFIKPINTVFTFSDKTLKLLCERYSYSVLSISLIIVGTFLINLIEKYKATKIFIKAFSFLGGISLEIYLVHVCMLRLIEEYNLMHTFKPWVYYIGVLGLSIILGLLFNKISNKIIKNKI